MNEKTKISYIEMRSVKVEFPETYSIYTKKISR